MKDYHIEKRKTFDTEYLKVSIADNSQLEDVQKAILGIRSVQKVNITPNKRTDLTVYPLKMFSIDTVFNEVDSFLKKYEPGSKEDPIINTDLIEGNISNKSYLQIIEAISTFGRNIEKTPATYQSWGEEDFRNYFLPHLNAISSTTTSTGETFNNKGKTDILIQNTKGENLFIAECKLWKGEAALTSAISQLLERYVSWRDSKLALIIFNKDMKNFSELLTKAHNSMKAHPNYLRTEDDMDKTKTTFIFKHPSDKDKEVKITLLLFNYCP